MAVAQNEGQWEKGFETKEIYEHLPYLTIEIRMPFSKKFF